MNFSLSLRGSNAYNVIISIIVVIHFYLSFWPCTFRIFDFVLRPMWNSTQCWRTAYGIVIDVLLLNYVHIMIFIVCACSESAPCLRMRVSKSNISEFELHETTYRNVYTIRDGCSMFGCTMLEACEEAHSIWKAKPISFESNGFIYLFDCLWMNRRLKPYTHTACSKHELCLSMYRMYRQHMDFLACFRMRNSFDLIGISAGR